ncbi:hypothetical protein [Streptomyces sp. NPDC058092]|uniref:hypothetical protein n=1 Tax=Streptomyces sp. NPDC058092 TaxID=3346336 RepID=UPI0036EEDE94
MTAIDTDSGPALAESLLHGVGNENWQAATRLLGAHRDGYWLRRFLDMATIPIWDTPPIIDRSGTHPCIAWNSLGGRLNMSGGDWPKASSSEIAVLQVAASLMGEWQVDLRRVIYALDDDELRLVLRAIAEVGNVSISTA